MKLWERLTVPPLESITIPFLLSVYDPGPFEASTSLYVENGNLVTVPIRVRGVVRKVAR